MCIYLLSYLFIIIIISIFLYIFKNALEYHYIFIYLFILCIYFLLFLDRKIISYLSVSLEYFGLHMAPLPSVCCSLHVFTCLE